MNHREFLASLSADQRRTLTRTTNRHGLVRLASHLAVITLLASGIALRVPGWPVLMLPLGVMLVFLFCLQHEAVHQSVFRSPWLNTATAHVCGLIVIVPAIWFRYFHLAHHRHTQAPDSDPELSSPRPATRAACLFWLTGLPAWKAHTLAVVQHAIHGTDADFVPERARRVVRREARIALGVYMALAALSVYAQSTVLLWLWIVPVLFGQPLLRVFLLAEHAGCSHSNNMLHNTRTTLTTAPVRWLSWNMSFHTEHHVYPTVPFHRLPELHKLIRPQLGMVANGYFDFYRSFRAALPR